jgi:glycosyltransferase involved in cell wall biosynthesis
LIYDAHELESDKAGQTKILSKCTLFIEKIAWKKVDFFISVSPSILNWYNSNFGYKKSELILNSPEFRDANNIVTKNNYLREKFSIPEDEKIYLYLGIISKFGRGIELYLEAFKSININSHLVFIGYGDFVDEIKVITNEYSNIHYHPAVSHDQVVEIAKSADVGLCLIEPISLSDTYSLPNKLFEYAFSNLYILSSDLPDIRKTIEDFDLGTYCKNDISDLIKSIELINKNGCLRKIVDTNSLYHLSWLYQEEKLLEIYKNLL